MLLNSNNIHILPILFHIGDYVSWPSNRDKSTIPTITRNYVSSENHRQIPAKIRQLTTVPTASRPLKTPRKARKTARCTYILKQTPMSAPVRGRVSLQSTPMNACVRICVSKNAGKRTLIQHRPTRVCADIADVIICYAC